MSFRFIPRSAVYGQTSHDPDAPTPSRAAQARSMPGVRWQDPRAGAPPRVNPGAMPAVQQVQLLKGAVVKLQQDRQRIVKEANAKLGALANRVRQLEGFIRTGYAPNAQVPGGGQVDVGVPTHALRNPNVYGVDGGRGAPPAQDMAPDAGNPNDAAGHPGTNANPNATTVREAEEAIFYGSGDAAFYEGGEND